MSSVAVPVSPLPRPSAAELRRHLEAKLADRIPAALSPHERTLPEMASSGIAALDQLTGGWPRGTLSELFGPASSGRTSVLLAALAAATARGEVCALIDAGDAFDPESAAAAGVDLKKLLWVRCGNRSPRRHEDTKNQSLHNCHPERAPQARVEGSLRSRKTFPDCHSEAEWSAAEESAFQFDNSAVRQFGNCFVSSCLRGEDLPMPAPRDIGIWGYGDTETMERVAPHLARKNTPLPQKRGGAEKSLPFAICHLPSPAPPRLRGEPLPRAGRFPPAYARLEQATKAADLLLAGGGFGLLAIDLAGLPPEAARRVPLTTWFRFRRAVEPTPTVLLLLSPQPLTQSCAALSLALCASSFREDQFGNSAVRQFANLSHAALLAGLRLHAEVIRSPLPGRKHPSSAQTEIITEAQWA